MAFINVNMEHSPEDDQSSQTTAPAILRTNLQQIFHGVTANLTVLPSCEASNPTQNHILLHHTVYNNSLNNHAKLQILLKKKFIFCHMTQRCWRLLAEDVIPNYSYFMRVFPS